MNKFKNKKKRMARILCAKQKELSEEQKKEVAKRLEETMEKQRKTIMNLHVPRPGRPF